MTKSTLENKRVVLICLAIILFMVGLSFAAVPLYNIFCRVTGYGGTTQISNFVDETQVINDRNLAMRFDTNVSPSLAWQFTADSNIIEIIPGEVYEMDYTVKNLSDDQTLGIASYNVSPTKVGKYFSKVECFCFTEQPLQPREIAKLKLTFFVNPDFAKDEYMNDVNEITLSYTFFNKNDKNEE
mgnify:CR=1 FL=1|tara:strand:- start:268 stop:819 length:552 start_codon:yes stop_codon:yes gene_type:complete